MLQISDAEYQRDGDDLPDADRADDACVDARTLCVKINAGLNVPLVDTQRPLSQRRERSERGVDTAERQSSVIRVWSPFLI